MMRRFLLKINKYLESVISYGGDRRVICKGNVCCRYFAGIEYMSIPALGIVRLNINFCPTCGRKLERE